MNLHRLNDSQKKAVLHGEGPLLILAGAGTGKTNTMAHRIAYLILEKKVNPLQILGVSFTNKAARELKERVKTLIASQKTVRSRLLISTFHSQCVKILREHAQKAGLTSHFSIIDTSDQTALLKDIFKDLKIDDRKFKLPNLLFEFSQFKNKNLKIEDLETYFFDTRKLMNDYALACCEVFPKYQNELKRFGFLDFDDLILKSIQLLEQNQDVQKKYHEKLQHILVDEYQDTNPAQFRLLELLINSKQNLVVVGDDDQSIYSWRGADSAHILKFHEHFKNSNVISLTQNYRSTPEILNVSNELISKNRHRHPKTLWSEINSGDKIEEVMVLDEIQEGRFVAQDIKRQLNEENRKLQDFAVLYRSNPQARIFETALREEKLYYEIIGGMSFYDRAEIKDALSYLKAIIQPQNDLALKRVINRPTRGIGKTTQETLLHYAEQVGISFSEAFKRSQHEGCLKLQNTFNELRTQLMHTSDPVSWMKTAFQQLELKRLLEEDSSTPEQTQKKWDNIEELIHAFGIHCHQKAEKLGPLELCSEFIDQLALSSTEEDKTDEKESSAITLMTLHGSKGLEFKVVYLVGMDEGLLPHKNVLEENTDLSEERRLCYVGFTRAQQKLILTRTKHRIKYGKEVPQNRSRFLEEISPTHFQFMDLSKREDFHSRISDAAHEQKVKDFLSSIRQNLGNSSNPAFK